MTTSPDPIRFIDHTSPRRCRLACVNGDLGDIVPQVDAELDARRHGGTVDELTDLEVLEQLAIDLEVANDALDVEVIYGRLAIALKAGGTNPLVAVITPAGELEVYGGRTNARLELTVRIANAGANAARIGQVAR